MDVANKFIRGFLAKSKHIGQIIEMSCAQYNSEKTSNLIEIFNFESLTRNMSFKKIDSSTSVIDGCRCHL